MHADFEFCAGLEEVRARRVAQEVRVLCWIMTTPKNHMDKAFHVKTTWGRHCNTLLFMSEGDGETAKSVLRRSWFTSSMVATSWT